MSLDKVQRLGRRLSGMVQPNIGAFVAWGLITALFIPTGWAPSETLAKLVGPTITYLLPLLIAYSGGKMVYDHRGGVIATIMTMGVIVGSSIPMFLGAMICGPLAAFLLKKIDAFIDPKIPNGFEMLINNFSLGILGMILAIGAFYLIGPAVEGLSSILGRGVEFLVKARLFPFISILVEPAKVLFLNNAINHGVFTPLGAAQAAEIGKSLFFTVETNPGPGLGVLLAYMFFGKGTSKASAPGSVVIHFFGGIHEIYFPYVLMNPILLVALIAGGMGGVLVNIIFSGGYIAVPSPGSIFAILAVTPKGGLFTTLLSVLLSATITFLLSIFFIKRQTESSLDIEKAQAQSKKNKNLSASSDAPTTQASPQISPQISPRARTSLKGITKIVVACDAGMGSSAMGATMLKRLAKERGVEGLHITNVAISDLSNDVELVITQKTFTSLVQEKMGDAVPILTIDNFMDKSFYADVLDKIEK